METRPHDAANGVSSMSRICTSMEGVTVYASLSAGDKLYGVTRQGDDRSRRGRSCPNWPGTLDDPALPWTPAVCNGCLLIRSDRFLYSWKLNGQRLSTTKKAMAMPLFEIETESHIVITWADNEETPATRRVIRLNNRAGDETPPRYLVI